MTIPNTATNIGDHTFSQCASLAGITIGNSVTSIGSLAFSGCGKLTSIAIPDSVTNIKDGIVVVGGGGAFSYCFGLTNITLGAGVTNIGDYTFFLCTSLTRLIIPDSVVRMSDALVNCTSLASLNIGSGVTNLDVEFPGCTSLTEINVNPANTAYSSRDGALFNKPQTTLVRYPLAKGGNYTVASSVTNIDLSAFDFCTSLAGVYFQGNAPSVGGGSFTGDDDTTIYYLPGTRGWNSTFGGRPAVLWNPQAQTNDGGLGVRPNGFGFNITGTTGIPIVIEACTNLAAQEWVSLQNGTLTNGSVHFQDPQWTNFPERFYRFRSP